MNIEPLLVAGRAALDNNGAETARWNYYLGRHDLPWASPSETAWYEALRVTASTSLIRLAVRSQVQRLKVEAIRTGDGEDVDQEAWNLWRRNRLSARQKSVYTKGLVFEKGGIIGVWMNPADPKTPLIRPEDPMNVHVARNAIDPLDPPWAFKRYTESIPASEGSGFVEVTHEFLYTREFIWHLTNANGDEMTLERAFKNPMRRVPFVVFQGDLDSDGTGTSYIDSLIPIQKMIDKITFDLLIASQFGAFKQKVATGFDPRVRDENGEVVYHQTSDGEVILDSTGNPIPVIETPDATVDSLLVFPDPNVKVFELSETDLRNYTETVRMLKEQFAAVAQVSQHSLSGQMTNVSGSSREADETSSRAFTADLQVSFSDSWTAVFDLANIARGADALPLGTEVDWLYAVPMTWMEIGQTASQMGAVGAPLQMFLEMAPGATPHKVARWMQMRDSSMERVMNTDLASLMTGEKPALEE